MFFQNKTLLIREKEVVLFRVFKASTAQFSDIRALYCISKMNVWPFCRTVVHSFLISDFLEQIETKVFCDE